MSRRRPSRTSIVCPTPHKMAFGNQSVAVARINEIRAHACRGIKTPSRAYACACGAWHLTSKD